MNIVMTETGGFVELQGTGEDGEFSKEQLNQMITLGSNGISEISLIQKVALGGS
jgi:ribonuclease PH